MYVITNISTKNNGTERHLSWNSAEVQPIYAWGGLTKTQKILT